MIKLTELVPTFKIYCDMDDVLTDFNNTFLPLVDDGMTYKSGWEFQEKHGAPKLWSIIHNKGKLEFWSDMLWMPDGKRLWDYISKYNNTEILSAPARKMENSRIGKKIWVKRELRLKDGSIPKLILDREKEKYAEKNHILIDDWEKNITKWESMGGIGILHTSANDTIEQLKRLGI